jgi:tetratricopeptide (TPR) repeat protein
MSLVPINSSSSPEPLSFLPKLEKRWPIGIQVILPFLSIQELTQFENSSNKMRMYTDIRWKRLAKNDPEVFRWWASEGTLQRDKWNYILSKTLLKNAEALTTKSFGRPMTLSGDEAPFYGLLVGASLQNRSFDNHEESIGNALEQVCAPGQGKTGEIFLAGLIELRQFNMEPYLEGLEAIEQQMRPAIEQGVAIASMLVIDSLKPKPADPLTGEEDPLNAEIMKLHSSLAIASAEKGDFGPLEKIIEKMDVEFLVKYQERDFPPILLALSSHYIAKKEFSQAWELIERAVALYGENPPLVLLEHGVAAASALKKWTEALVLFSRIPPKDLKDEVVLHGAAKAYTHQAKWLEAVALLEQIIKGHETPPVAFIDELAQVKKKQYLK